MIGPYPASPNERSEWIVARRSQRAVLDPEKPYLFFVEEECSSTGEVVPVATVFLTNRECPWRCLMCDLWKNTLTESVAPGVIPRQIAYALERLPAAREIKLYNSGSFFDSNAIPPADYAGIARIVSAFDRAIVECHPALVSRKCVEFRDLLGRPLEIAMGLETAHPEILDRLNKRMTLDQFAQAAFFLRENHIDLRVFILVQPPFMKTEESLYWAQRSLDFAFRCDATAATLIPTRAGNGAMESLAGEEFFRPPSLEIIEAAMEYGLRLNRGRVFVDEWDCDRIPAKCALCRTERWRRIHGMNLLQRVLDPILCPVCEGRD